MSDLRPRPRAARGPAVLLALVMLLPACKEVQVPGVYRIDIQQGNVISQEQLAALEKGMEKRKVRFILGTPLVTDAFNQDRWDYYYSLEKRGEDRVQRIVSVFFENERLVRVSGDVRAADGPIVVDAKKDEVVSVPDGYRDEGILASLMPGLLSGKPKRQEAQAAATGDGAQPPGAAGATQPPTAAAVTLTTEDERQLRELLAGFGQESSTTPPAAEAAPASTGGEAPAKTEEEGLLSRWARRLGLGDDEQPPPPPAPPAQE